MKHFLIGLMLTGMGSICYASDELSEQQKLEYAMQYACDSFKQELNFSSPYIEFDSCVFRETEDITPCPLMLKYKVKGEFAEQIEKQLHEQYKMPLFKKQESVALWETDVYRGFSDSDYMLHVGFFSDWTQVQDRKDWHQIPYFYIFFEKMPSP